MTNKYMYFVANWKMYGNLSSLNTLDKVIKFSKSKEIKGGRLIYCPPNTLISSFSKKLKQIKIFMMKMEILRELNMNNFYLKTINLHQLLS